MYADALSSIGAITSADTMLNLQRYKHFDKVLLKNVGFCLVSQCFVQYRLIDCDWVILYTTHTMEFVSGFFFGLIVAIAAYFLPARSILHVFQRLARQASRPRFSWTLNGVDMGDVIDDNVRLLAVPTPRALAAAPTPRAFDIHPRGPMVRGPRAVRLVGPTRYARIRRPLW